MSNRSSPSPAPLRVDLLPSRRLRWLALALAAGLQAAICYAALPIALQLALSAALALHFIRLLRRAARGAGCLLWRGEHWLWIDGQASEHILYLHRATAWPGLIVLGMREPARAAAPVFVLLADSAAADAQRRLRAALRYLPVFGGAGEEGEP